MLSEPSDRATTVRQSDMFGSSVLLGPHAGIEAAVEQCIERAGGPGSHILNLGHGVVPQTPEDAVEVFIEKAKSMRREG